MPSTPSSSPRLQRRALVSKLDRLRSGSDVHRLNFDWLIRLRWVAFIGQSAVIVASWQGLGLDFPYLILAVILFLEVLSNLALIGWARTSRPRHEAMGALVLIADIVFLTALLHFTGGAANPFALLYIIHVALAALILRPLWTWVITVISVAAYVGLHFFPNTAHYLPWASPPDISTLEVQGRWVAFFVSAAVIAFFINMIQRALQRRDEELIRVRDARMRDEKLASLATLAAGAAHEFSTPLSTIALVANELKHRLENRDVPDEFIDDARLIRDQVERCRDILRQMSADAGESMGELLQPMEVDELVDRVVDECRNPKQIDVTVHTDPGATIRVPPTAIAQALRGLVNNALDASADDQNVAVDIDDGDPHFIVEIRDDGVGMPTQVLERVGEPFFTTKEAGDGMGLGVFLARTLIEKIGGQLHIASAVGEGTTVTAHLPADPSLTPPRDSETDGHHSNPFEVFHE